MANPAYELAAILEGWKFGGGTALASARKSYASSVGASEADVIARGMTAVVQIRERLAEIAATGVPVEAFLATLPLITQDFTDASAVNPQNGQPTGATRLPTSKERIDNLKGMGAFLDMQAAAFRPRPQYVAGIDAAIRNAEQFVEETDVQPEYRHYLLALLARIRTALHEGHLAEYRKTFHEFVGATATAEAVAPEAAKAGWRNLRQELMMPMLSGAAGNLLATGLVAVAGLIG